MSSLFDTRVRATLDVRRGCARERLSSFSRLERKEGAVSPPWALSEMIRRERVFVCARAPFFLKGRAGRREVASECVRDGRICFTLRCHRTEYRRRGASSLRTRRFVTGRREAIRNSVFPSGPPLREGHVAPHFTKSSSVVGFSASRPRVRVHGFSQAEEGG